MTRQEFIKLTSFLLASPLFAKSYISSNTTMPAFFISHGSPMNIIKNNSYTRSLSHITQTFEKPKAIIVISAHWYEDETLVSNSLKQETIHDFYNFPDELYEVLYEPNGDIKLATKVSNSLHAFTEDRGLDHGAWSVLKHMYPLANIPTFQISINQNLSYMQHFEIGTILKRLRQNGVVIIGSGSVTHNLSLTNAKAKKIDAWAIKFDNFVKDAFSHKKLGNIIHAKKHPLFSTAHPFDDHYIPLLYTAGCIDETDKIEHFHEEIVSGNLTMRCIKVG